MSVNTEDMQLKQLGYTQDLKRVLPLSSLIYYGLAFLVPVTIFSTYGIVTNLTHGMVSLTYLVATIAMTFTALSYAHMVKAYPVAGSVYSYVHRTMNPHIGFLSGWTILIDYLLIPMLNYMLAGIFISAALPGIPSWAIILCYIAIVTMVNYFGVRITAWVNNALTWIQLIFIVAFILFVVNYLAGGGGTGTFFDWSAFFNKVELGKPEMGWGIILTGASILALSFLGFDAVSTLSEEAIHPEKNLGRAILIVCLGAGIGFVLLSYLAQLAWPNAWNEIENIDAGGYELIAKVAGPIMGYIFTAVGSVGALASAVAGQASASRILYGMGRDGILPKRFFAGLHPKYKTPTNNIFLIAILSLSALFFNLTTAVSFVNFGALLGFVMVNLSVIAHFYLKKKQRSATGTVLYLILPVLGALISLSLWYNLNIDSKVLGLIWVVIGVIVLAVRTSFFRKLPPEMKLEE